jgi:CRP-like cAMP-binding protein
MATTKTSSPPRIACHHCPLRQRDSFRDFENGELDFIATFKTGDLMAEPGASIMTEGERNAQLYTVLSGWGFRYKILEDGRRQILNYILPGDLVGLQGNVMLEMQHSVEAMTRMSLCVFDRDKLMTLYEKHPSLAYDITWIAAREETMLDEHLLSVGRRSALERAAYLLAFLDWRAKSTGAAADDKPANLPVTQQHCADTLGLSLVHTNKTFRKLAADKLIRWLDKGCEVVDVEALRKLAGWTPPVESKRPFL